MSRADVRDVVAIERDSYALPWSAATFRALLQRRNTLLRVAEDRRGVAGYAVLWLAAEEAELGNLAVRPGRRQRGIGRLLLQHVLEEAAARGARAIFLEVRESNSVALRLYEGAGFRVVGTRPDYYASPREAALVMRLDRVGCSLTSPPGGR
ncbi:MAG: ribosomal protein S18-alanine N-acetyltransferase [Gemmatimonadota bacterium]|jgi:ribosomal-protein-alanine N-acetyltransferase|nr:MAG: ribosomal protein S18-alanine N-acetyltransferase [Gemmatimonadota bacterium]